MNSTIYVNSINIKITALPGSCDHHQKCSVPLLGFSVKIKVDEHHQNQRAVLKHVQSYKSPEYIMSSIEENFPEVVIPGDLICPLFRSRNLDGVNIVEKYIPKSGCTAQKFEVSGKSIDVLVSTLKGTVEVKEVKTDFITSNESLTEVKEETSQPKSEQLDENTKIREFEISVTKKSKIPGRYVDEQFSIRLPQEGAIVLARVTRISLQRINVEIIAVENGTLPVDSGVGSNGTGFIAPGGGAGAATFSVSQASSDLGETFRGIIRSQDVRATDRDRVRVMDSFKPGDIVRAQVLSLGDGQNYYLTTARNDLGVVFAKASNGAGEQMYALDWQTMISPQTGLAEKRKCAKPF